MTDEGKTVEQHAMDAVVAYTELVGRLVEVPLEYPLDAYRIRSGLARCANELPHLLELLEGGVDRLYLAGHLAADYRGAPLAEKLQDFRAGLAIAGEAAESVRRGLRQSFEAIGHVAYEDDAAPQP